MERGVEGESGRRAVVKRWESGESGVSDVGLVRGEERWCAVSYQCCVELLS